MHLFYVIGFPAGWQQENGGAGGQRPEGRIVRHGDTESTERKACLNGFNGCPLCVLGVSVVNHQTRAHTKARSHEGRVVWGHSGLCDPGGFESVQIGVICGSRPVCRRSPSACIGVHPRLMVRLASFVRRPASETRRTGCVDQLNSFASFAHFVVSNTRRAVDPVHPTAVAPSGVPVFSWAVACDPWPEACDPCVAASLREPSSAFCP